MIYRFFYVFYNFHLLIVNPPWTKEIIRKKSKVWHSLQTHIKFGVDQFCRSCYQWMLNKRAPSVIVMSFEHLQFWWSRKFQTYDVSRANQIILKISNEQKTVNSRSKLESVWTIVTSISVHDYSNFSKRTVRFAEVNQTYWHTVTYLSSLACTSKYN